MKTPDLQLGSEWALLELVCLGLECEEHRSLFSELITSKGLHWGAVIERALSHKLLPMLSLHLVGSELAHRVPRFVRELFETQLALNRHRNTLLRAEAARIMDALDQSGVRFAATKGITLESSVYGGKGGRTLRDIDFMVDRASSGTVMQAMDRLGYVVGSYNWHEGKIVPLSRRQLAEYHLSECHLPEMVRLNDSPLVPYLAVDFATSFTWTRSPYAIPVARALEENVQQDLPGCARAMPTLSPDYQFIFTSLHLFREAWLERWLIVENDVNLIKFVDVMRLWDSQRAHRDPSGFAARLEQLGIVEPVLWVFEHLDRTFGTEIVPSLGLSSRVDEDWLTSALGAGGRRRRWTGTMRERLHCSDRRALLT